MSQRRATPNLLERAALDSGGKAQGHGIPYSRRVRRAYDLRSETVKAIAQIATLERFHHKAYSIIVQALLDASIEAYEAGELEIDFRLESDGMKRATFQRSTPKCVGER